MFNFEMNLVSPKSKVMGPSNGELKTVRVFFNLFFEAEPFTAILIARGIHARSQEFVLHFGRTNSQENASSSLNVSFSSRFPI